MIAGEQLGKEEELEAYWFDNVELGAMYRFFMALGEVALPSVAGRPLVIFVDEVDAVRSLPFPADEFFAGVRECYNRRATDPAFVPLTFCLVGSATPTDLITDMRVSPFNIGHHIRLTDFTEAEAAPLSRGLPGGPPTLSRILYWTGGHPYLTQRLCLALAERAAAGATVERIDAAVQARFLAPRARSSDTNLAFVQDRLLHSDTDRAAVLDLYARLRRGDCVPDDETNPLCATLKFSGVAKEEGSVLVVRNRIYERVFDESWITGHLSPSG
jgi:hypothetical protein